MSKRLSPLVRPKTHLNLEVVRVPLGERVQLNCSVAGNPMPEVIWKTHRHNIVKHSKRITLKIVGAWAFADKALLRFDEFCSCCCLPLLPQLACNLQHSCNLGTAL